MSSWILKHPENRSHTGYGWKTKTARFKKRSKHHLQAIICCLLATQIGSTTDNHFITAAVFTSRPKRHLSNFPQWFIFQRSYRSGTQSILKRLFHGLTRESSRIHSSASQLFWQLWNVFLSPWDRQYLPLEIYSLACHGTAKIPTGRTSRHNIGGKKQPKHILHPDRYHKLAFRPLNAICSCFRNGYNTELCHPFCYHRIQSFVIFIHINCVQDSQQATDRQRWYLVHN